MAKMFPGKYSGRCPRCNVHQADTLHMLWSCGQLSEFWRKTVTQIEEVCNFKIEADPRIILLHLFEESWKKGEGLLGCGAYDFVSSNQGDFEGVDIIKPSRTF